MCVVCFIPASWVRRPSAALVVISAHTRAKKQAWRLVTHTHTGNIRELNSALRTRGCARLYSFGSAVFPLETKLNWSFFAFELRRLTKRGASFPIWQLGHPVCQGIFCRLLRLWTQSTEAVRPPTSDGSRVFPVRTEASAFLASLAESVRSPTR